MSAPWALPPIKRPGDGALSFRVRAESINYAAEMIRITLPFHLRNLARVEGDVKLDVAAPVTIAAVLDALEIEYPVLRGAIRDHGTLRRRPFVRFFACQRDLSHDPTDCALPEAVAAGEEPFLIVGAIAGG